MPVGLQSKHDTHSTPFLKQKPAALRDKLR